MTTTTTQDVAAPAPQTEEEKRKAEEERKAAYKEAAIELGKGIALGLVPFLGQAIDVYDTIESSISLYNAKKDDDKENAQFDLILAIVGWVPGPGDGVKKSLRLVNKNPDRFAPVLFDLLRFVLQECGLHTSPEALLEEIFNASKLKAQLKDIKEGIEDSSVFQNMPEGAQHAVKSTMNAAMVSLPMMVLVVEKRIKKWTKKQPNSSARVGVGSRANSPQPGTKKEAGTGGGKRASGAGTGGTATDMAATVAISEITNEAIGISGEHIADYMCAETFKWGKWKSHDMGADGQFEVTPGKRKPGKLSAGGSPKKQHILYKLTDGANGTGIDAVWRVDTTTKSARQKHKPKKPYAIVEAKASRDEDAPKFARKLNHTRKPSITSTLGANVVESLFELIEPLDDASASTPARNKQGGGARKRVAGASTPPKPASKPNRSDKKVTRVRVQMSPKWIDDNIERSVGLVLAGDIRTKGYERHMFYSPAYHLSADGSKSPWSHMVAKHSSTGPETHAKHDAYYYEEDEVDVAVTKRMKVLKAKYGAINGLEGV